LKVAAVLLAVAAALVLQTTFARFVTSSALAVDFVLVVVVFVALKGGPVAGLLTGTIGGLAQDALSSSVIGIGGLAKTTVGFLAGVIGTQFIVARSIPRLVVFAAATLVHALIFVGLYELLGLRDFGVPSAALAWQAAGNAVFGVLALQAAEALPGVRARRSTARTGLRR
jgi:rod shape-determining protein MreD